MRASVWLAPVGEYLFVLLQVALTGLWVARVATGPAPRLGATAVQRVGGFAAGGAVGGAGLLLVGRGPTYYLGAILLWAGPVLALQWAVGWPALWRRRRTVLVGVAVPTVYLCAVDRIALSLGLWRLSSEHTTGVTLLGLPVEEATFFLVTNAFVVQGLLLYGWVVERWR
ncbi:lycopene cyclase domain-containing protein [Halobacteriaceae archaeon GCM10025711]